MNHLNLFIVSENSWKFGINDPSFIAWVIVGAYFVTTAFCWRARTRAPLVADSANGMLWTFLTFVIILLGVNKQLDLHKWIMDFGRELFAGGNVWPGLLVGILAIAGLLTVAVGLLRLKTFQKPTRELCLAYLILFGLLSLQALRFLPGPISGLLLMHVITEEEGLLHIHSIELLELGSLVAITYSAGAQVLRQPANKNVPTNPLLGGTVGSRGRSLLVTMPKLDLKLI